MSAAAHAAGGRRHGHSAPRGQFFTPDSVARFLWQVVALFRADEEARVIDLAAGEGALLDAGCDGGWVSARSATGLEIDDRFVASRRRPHPRIDVGDGLFDRPPGPAGQADIVVGNPPFGRCRDLLSEAQQERLATDRAAPVAIWGDAVHRDGRLSGPAGSRRVEQLFLERGLRLVREQGIVAYIVPDTLLSNRREQPARDWLGARAQLLAAVALPASAFRRPGLNAHAHLILLHKAGGRAAPALMLERRPAGRGQLPRVLEAMLSDLQRLRAGSGDVDGSAVVPADQLPSRRWDSGYWVGRSQRVCSWNARLPTRDLGDFVELLTYGPIVTGSRAEHVPQGVVSVRQGDFTETGLRRHDLLRIAPDSDHDPPRSRLRRGDLLMPRSGGGALGRNRVAVYDADEPANIGCFVDLIRLQELNPYYAWVFLRSRPGWGQIRSLINGVGTPNISFREIRSLRVPLLPPPEQSQFEDLYRSQVLPIHLRAHRSDDLGRQAEAAFDALVCRLERRLGIADGPARPRL